MKNRVKIKMWFQKRTFRVKKKLQMKNKKARKSQRKMINKQTKIKNNKNKLVYK